MYFIRHKLGGGAGESILVSQLQHGLTLEFEHSDSPRRLRLVLSELLAIMNKVHLFELQLKICMKQRQEGRQDASSSMHISVGYISVFLSKV